MKTFMDLAREAMAVVPGITPHEADKRARQDGALIVDVRDAADTADTGIIPGAASISLGMLPVRADVELPESWRDDRLRDRSRPVIVTCALGPNGARGARDLKEMGFRDVAYIEGGIEAWRAAGLPTAKG